MYVSIIQILMSVPGVPITAVRMHCVLIQMAAIYALATLVIKETGGTAQVIE